MIAFTDLTLYPRTLFILMMLFISVLLFFFALITIYRCHWVSSVPLTVIALCGGLFSWLLLCLHEASLSEVTAPQPYLYDLSIWKITLCYGLLLFLGILLMGYHLRKFHHTISVNSIKESADNLPTGMCFSYENGLPLLMNRKMEELCTLLTKKGLWNTNIFWDTLTKGHVAEGISVLGTFEIPIFRFPDGTTWTFTRQCLISEGNLVYQLLAIDTTELHRLGEQREQDNKALSAMNKRLRSYSDELITVTRKEEILKAKITIHDYLGQVLLASKHHLANKTEHDDLSSAALLNMWQKCVDLLHHEMSQEKGTDPILQLKDAANAVGVALEIKGHFPYRDAQASRLIFLGAKEALTNAVYHGAATRLCIECSEDPLMYTAVFTNDGKFPEKILPKGADFPACENVWKPLAAVCFGKEIPGLF